MIIAKGQDVAFKLQSGRIVRPRGSMLHDPTGQDWPKDSLLVASFRRSGWPATDAEKSGDPKNYLGRQYEAHVGIVNLPPKSLSEWKHIGDVATIYYERPGTRAPGRFYHHFGKRRIEVFFKKGSATLYKREAAYCVDLGSGAIADDRGIVFP
jgi:hypothetical protein